MNEIISDTENQSSTNAEIDSDSLIKNARTLNDDIYAKEGRSSFNAAVQSSSSNEHIRNVKLSNANIQSEWGRFSLTAETGLLPMCQKPPDEDDRDACQSSWILKRATSLTEALQSLIKSTMFEKTVAFWQQNDELDQHTILSKQKLSWKKNCLSKSIKLFFDELTNQNRDQIKKITMDAPRRSLKRETSSKFDSFGENIQ